MSYNKRYPDAVKPLPPCPHCGALSTPPGHKHLYTCKLSGCCDVYDEEIFVRTLFALTARYPPKAVDEYLLKLQGQYYK